LAIKLPQHESEPLHELLRSAAIRHSAPHQSLDRGKVCIIKADETLTTTNASYQGLHKVPRFSRRFSGFPVGVEKPLFKYLGFDAEFDWTRVPNKENTNGMASDLPKVGGVTNYSNHPGNSLAVSNAKCQKNILTSRVTVMYSHTTDAWANNVVYKSGEKWL